MALCRRPKYQPPRWAANAGECVLYGGILLCVATILFGLMALLLG